MNGVSIDQASLANQLLGEGGPVAVDLLRRGFRVESAAKVLAPVDTGLLRASITTNLVNAGTEDAFVAVGTLVFYGLFQEVGWVAVNGRAVEGRHFLELALPEAA